MPVFYNASVRGALMPAQWSRMCRIWRRKWLISVSPGLVIDPTFVARVALPRAMCAGIQGHSRPWLRQTIASAFLEPGNGF